MSKNRVIVLAVTTEKLTPTEAAERYGVSRQWIYQLLKRYYAGGLEAVEPRSRRPKSNPNTVPDPVRTRIIQLRHQLTSDGLDAGPVTIAWHLKQEHLAPPAVSTIRRILTSESLITPEPKKRPKSSLHRFQADQPNECWQSDFTHWRLADGTDVEILNWIDDHSRFLLAATVYPRVTGQAVISEFSRLIDEYGTPASTLTDNGFVYTTRFRGSRNGFEHLLSLLGITQKNGAPNHPQTQGKIERFHQTEKLWLSRQPVATTLEELQQQLDTFRRIYNTQRPHRALDRRTPAEAYTAGIRAIPERRPNVHYRIRIDRVDAFGKVTLRHGAILRHLGVGRANAGKAVLLVVDDTRVLVTDQNTGEVLSENLITPETNYWRNKQKSPGRWPGLFVNDDPDHA